VSEDELEAALAQQRLSTSWRLGEILVNRGVVTPAGIARAIAEQYELPFVDLSNAYVDPAVISRLPREVARNFPAVPIAECSDGSLQIAIADPTNVYYSDELQGALGTALTFVVAAPDAIDAVIESVHEPVTEPEHAETQDGAVAKVTALELHHELPLTVEVDEVDVETADDFPEFAHGTAAVDEVVDDVVGAERDDLIADLEEPVTEDAPDEEISAESDVTDVVQEHGAAEVVPAPAETETQEPILGWLPTWTTEIQLMDDEPVFDHESALDDEPEATAGEADDLSAALLAEVARSDEPEDTNEGHDLEESYESVGQWEHPDDEVAPAEPAPVIALVEYVEVEDDAPEDEPAEDSEPPSAVEQTIELGATASTVAVELGGPAVEEVLRLGATAVHLSPSGHEYVVRARVDGNVRELGVVSGDDLQPLVDRLQSSVPLRVHVLPTTKGDKITLFPLDGTTAPTELAELGLTGDPVAIVRDALARPYGALVVCGPVGSGTTTTLYAALATLNTPDRVVATIEAPVARVLDGVDQTEVDLANGVSFAEGLRTLFATDSDVVLVGEIGDRETADVAFAGALAGRHVLSALRAPSAAAAIRRLLDLGLEPSRVSDALTCVVAQRLVRRVCLDCRETYYASESELAELGQPLEDAGPRLLARGRGCESCDGTGFHGRVGIFEVLRMTDEIRALVADDASAKKLQRAAVAGGMRTLREDGVRLCLEGITTSAELQRVLGADV
jgi:type II secretory ATPase GspE/PulE/Tfp pilus assembly ATPase PilB-like protein